MRSSGSPDRLALDRDLPTTDEDVAALRRLRHAEGIDLEGYLGFLGGFTPPAPSALRSRRGPAGPPFCLTE